LSRAASGLCGLVCVLALTVPLGAEAADALATRHVVVAGDSWAALATQYWGDAALGEELAVLSGSGPELPERGRSVLVPGLVRHRLAKGETLIALSRRIYGGPDAVTAIASLNGIGDPRRLHVGQVLRIPQLEPVRELASSTPAVSAAPESVATEPAAVGSAPPPLESFTAELDLSEEAFLSGHYGLALQNLERLRPRVLGLASDAERSRMLRQLTFVYAAYDRERELCESYRALRQIDPEAVLDGPRVSPKIVGMTRSCDEF